MTSGPLNIPQSPFTSLCGQSNVTVLQMLLKTHYMNISLWGRLMLVKQQPTNNNQHLSHICCEPHDEYIQWDCQTFNISTLRRCQPCSLSSNQLFFFLLTVFCRLFVINHLDLNKRDRLRYTVEANTWFLT